MVGKPFLGLLVIKEINPISYMDNKKNTGAPDRERINVNEDYELQYWTKKFNVNPEELKKAVKAVGTSVKDVENFFKK
jgi:hypothetical protein